MTSHDPNHRVWTSGNFTSQARANPPYNGLKITGDLAVDQDGKLTSVKVTFTDYTNVKDGISSEIGALTVADGWVAVPQPVPGGDGGNDTVHGGGNDTLYGGGNDTVAAYGAPFGASNDTPSGNDTVSGGGNDTVSGGGGNDTVHGGGGNDIPVNPADFTVKGRVMIASEINGRFLRVDLGFGDTVQHEIGFIFSVEPAPAD